MAQLVKTGTRKPIAELNRASRRKQKLPFTLWKLVDIRKNAVVAISTWSAVSGFVCSHEPRGRLRGKVDNPFRAEMLNMRDPNAFVATPDGVSEPVKSSEVNNSDSK